VFSLLYLTAAAGLAVYGVHRLVLSALYWTSRRAAVEPAPLPVELPVVTVQLPLFNERYVAERLLDSVAALDWPRDRLEIQVLDDSTDDTRAICAARVAELRAAGWDAVHLHRESRVGFKAGALAAGLARARGDLVLVLDADFVPRPDMLRRVVGHFRDHRVGMVQVRWGHINRDYSFLTRVQAVLLDGHFVVEQSARARTGRFFNFNGTAGVWRRAAIEQAGGWQCDTLTEDLDLSYRALLAGWQFRYCVDETAPAELPVDINAFKSQQFRWAKGSVQVARKLLPAIVRAPLPWQVRVEAALHLTQNLSYLLTLLLAVAWVPAVALEGAPLLGRGAEAALLGGTAATLALYCAFSQQRLARRGWLRGLLAVPGLVAVTAGICVNQARAVVEGLVGHQSEFVRTPKLGIVARGEQWRRRRYRGLTSLVPFAELALAIAFAGGALAVAERGAWSSVVVAATFCFGFAFVGLSSLAHR